MKALPPLPGCRTLGPMARREAPRAFTVCIHDVSPESALAIERLASGVRSRLGDRFGVAVIAGRLEGPGSQALARLRAACGRAEVLAHGLHHLRAPAPSLYSWATLRSDELVGLGAEETRRRVALARRRLEELWDTDVAGFVPPAWRYGEATMDLLAGEGYGYALGLTRLRRARSSVGLATLSWDPGRFAEIAWGLELAGVLLGRLSSRVPCVVLHPRDLERGLEGRAFAHIDALLRRGFSPLRPGELAARG